jgi:hypothetical protein
MLLTAWSLLWVLLFTQARSGPSVTAEGPVVKVRFSIDNRPDDPDSDTLFYPARKLRWTDFRGAPSRSGPSAAVSFTSFAYEGGSLLKKDTLFIDLVLQVFFVRNASWVRAGAADSHSLSHEQLHFDITWLVAQRFRKKVLEMEMTRDDYDGLIQYEYLESFREMNRLQDAFDEETARGLSTAVQRQWAEKIARGLEEAATVGPR